LAQSKRNNKKTKKRTRRGVFSHAAPVFSDGFERSRNTFKGMGAFVCGGFELFQKPLQKPL
jgi:hypothetical protein